MADRLLTETNIPEQFRTALYGDYIIDDDGGDPRILKQLIEWDPSPKKPSLLMYGKPGLGKTLLACATLNEYQSQFRPPNGVDDSVITVLRQERFPVYFVQLAEWVGLQIRSFGLQKEATAGIRDPTEYLEIDQLLQDLMRRVQMLVVDDVGKEHTTATGFAQDAFDLLVRTRHNRGLWTIYTSNVPLSQWSAQYSDSMQSLIRRSSLVLKFR
jgi:DNA replication protein DnaC